MILNKYGYCHIKLLDTNYLNKSYNTSNDIKYNMSISFILLTIVLFIFFIIISIVFVRGCDNYKRNTIYHNNTSTSTTEIINVDDDLCT
jgi:hypothetical protein